jgi:hypothetical protein
MDTIKRLNTIDAIKAINSDDASIRFMTVPVDAHHTDYCPRGHRCESCGAESPALAVVTRTVLAEVLCLTLCPRCAVSGRPPQVMLSTAERLVAQHAAHLSAGGERRVVRPRTGGGAP